MIFVMTVLDSVKAFKDLLEEVDPHLSLTPPEVHDLAEGPLGARLMQDLPSQEILAQDWRERLAPIKTPLEAAQTVLEWIQHRQETLEKMDDLEERRTAEMPIEEQA